MKKGSGLGSAWLPALLALAMEQVSASYTNKESRMQAKDPHRGPRRGCRFGC